MHSQHLEFVRDVYFDRNDVGEYFDLFACYPPYEVDHFLLSHAKEWQFNRMQVQ